MDGILRLFRLLCLLGATPGVRGGHGRLALLALPGMGQGCQMAKFDPFLSLDCARVEGVGAQS